MQAKSLGLPFFFLGVILLHLYTTVPFLWQLAGIPLAYPLSAANSGVLAMLPALVPAVGAVLMVVGGLIYGNKGKEFMPNYILPTMPIAG